MALSKVKPGQRVRLFAEAHNALVDLDAAAKESAHGDFDSTDGDGETDLIVVSSTAETANAKWKYQVRETYAAYSSTDWTGTESDASVPTKEARNDWEALTKAGYVSSVVTGLYPIPNGARVRGRMVEINGACFYRFKERNEPMCS